MNQPVEPLTVVSLACLGVLGLLGLRRLVLMDGLHGLRVVILTALLWLPLFGLFLMACPPFSSTCLVVIEE